ncbi:MAG: molecular chaperone HtpG, partial [Oscillospiraceae bacterium]
MEKKQFKAESKRLLDLMINSIYTNHEIFLRELISNASDAIDKLSYLSLTDDKVGLNRSDFAINIKSDKDAKTLTVSDNGIGMNKQALEDNLGIIANSGSLKFKEDLKENKPDDIDIIGQFGVGFYSAFMVSDVLTVTSKAYGEEQAYQWKSAGADGYEITECEKDSVGTEIVMQIKQDTETEKYSQFLEEYTLRNLIKKYSNYIRHPIKMDITKSREKAKVEGDADDKAPEYESYIENEILNDMVPIWHKSKKDVSDEDYNNFYKEKFFDQTDPIKSIHISTEGIISYEALMFIPSKTPYDYFTKEYEKGLQLYSNGVMIMEKCSDLLPEHFRFVKGIVDSSDLSLNISREMLQQDRQLQVIATSIEKKITRVLTKMLNDEREKYEEFFKNFGIQLKYGVANDYGAKKDSIKDLLLFYSSTEK